MSKEEEILLGVWKSLGRGIQWQHSTFVPFIPVLLPLIPCPRPGWHRLLSSKYARTIIFPIKASCKKPALFKVIAQWVDCLIPKYKGINFKSYSLPPYNGHGWTGYQLSCPKTFTWITPRIVRTYFTEIRASKQWKENNCAPNAKQWVSSPAPSQ